ncbi:MAG: cytochrome d ubiquinol oxidase subunit II [Acidobacteria bacterium]|nr:cytochrome d ubiquinol oxidase subunit II [Acidobacteriota bacterium]
MLITLIFLLVALSAYALLGGADFGGGILEATLRRHPHLQEKIQETLAPVWEANHVWLIAVIVILFVGFPAVYAEMMTMLFVPLLLALLGIILRGAFFTFRKYDPEPEIRRGFYTLLFRASSIFTPLMYGLIIASLLSPFPVILESDVTEFSDLFVAPWFTWLGGASAVFVFSLFGYVAAVFLFGEVQDKADRAVIGQRVMQFFAVTFLSGGVVLAMGAATGTVSWQQALNPIQLMAQAIATMGIIWMWCSLKQERIAAMRVTAGVQMMFILGGWFSTQYPVFMRFEDGRELTIWNCHAPDVTLYWLNLGLIVVLALVLPLLGYLYHVFRAENPI